MIAENAAPAEDVARLIPKQDRTEIPPPDVEVELRRLKVIFNCEAAFALAIDQQMHSKFSYILSSPDKFKESKYICIRS